MVPSSPAAPLPQVVLKPRRALPFFNRHPWVFQGAIQRIDGRAESGDEVALVSHEQQFIGRGLLNHHSNIRVRMYAWEDDARLDDDFWSCRLDEAIALRQRLYGPPTPHSACRMVYSEADGLSGLIVDQYGEWLLVQVNGLGIGTRLERIADLLEQKLHPRGIWLRTEKGIREAEGLELSDGLLRGEEPPRPLIIDEHGVQFAVDVVQGQKTGFFLDQRDNRRAVATYGAGGTLLDLFCYTGGFAVSAARLGQVASVRAVDVSGPALELGRQNAERNGVADRIEWIKSDSFKALEQFVASGERFDTVVLDPPKLARNRSGVEAALRGYFSLNRLAMDVVQPGGLLVTCSCSGHVDRDMFAEMLSKAAVKANRALQVLEIRGQSPDHPLSVHCLENAYLKCFVCRVI